MAGSMSDYLELRILDHVLGNTAAFTPSASGWMALYSTPPTDAGGGTEITGGGYARVAVQNNQTNWPNATTGTKTNGTAFEFPTATGDWGTASAFGIFDTVTVGNLWYWGILATAKFVGSGDTIRIPSGGCVITLD